MNILGVYSKYAWAVNSPSKDKKGIRIINTFQKISDESNCKPNKIWEDKGSKFYNRSMKSWLQDNDIDMYSINNEEKCVVAERISTLTNKIYKYRLYIKTRDHNHKYNHNEAY